MRKLLPYEHQLIESLGITKEEYLEFVAIQQEYKDPKIGTALDFRAADPGTQALVLTIIGTLFQVGAALLAPKPEIPDGGRRRRNREQRFAPTFGFNSTQELARYGDPINLVYTNQNALGDVRVAGSLVWSSIENFGSTQFMQLILALGASKIKGIDFTKTAFGQAGMAELDKQSVFIFAKAAGAEGFPPFKSRISGFGTKEFFPDRLKPSKGDDPACSLAVNGNIKKGFSQAYTPSTSTSLGVFDAIPINVLVKTRDKDGDREESNIHIEMRSGQKNNNTWRNRSGSFAVDNQIQLFFNNTKGDPGDKQPKESARDTRRQICDALDFGSTYMLGTAKFRLLSYETASRNIDQGEVFANFKCIEAGQIPSTAYGRLEPREENKELRKEYEQAKIILSDPHTEENVRTDAINITQSGIVDITFSGTHTERWYPVFAVDIELEDGTTKTVDYTVNIQSTYSFAKGGSIAYTQTLKDELNGNKPELKTRRIKKSIRRQIKALRDLIDDVNEGVYDGGDDLPWGNNNYNVGRDTAHEFTSDNNINGVSGSDIFRASGGVFATHGYDESFIGQDGNVRNSANDILYFSFIYIDREGRWNFFNFNGIGANQQGSDEPSLFPNDIKLKRRRARLANAEDDRQKKNKDKGKDLDQSRTKLKSSSIDSSGPTQTKSILNKDTVTSLADYDQDISDIDVKIELRRNKVDDRIKRNFEKMHKLATDIIKADIDYLEAIRDAIPPDNQTDRDGTRRVRRALKTLIKDKEFALDKVTDVLEDWDEYQKAFDNTFFAKCLVKAESASYDTLSLCNVVKFSLKTRLFRRISGRQKKYGDRKEKEYSASDNGVKSRMVFFRVFFSATGEAEEVVPYVFAIRHGSDADFYTQLGFYNAAESKKWKFRFEPVFDVTAEHSQRAFSKFAFLENSSNEKSVTHKGSIFFWNGREVSADSTRGYYPDETERGPVKTNEWDMFSVDSDTQVQFSFESGPEIALTAVTEQQVDRSIDNKYSNMTMMALGVFAGRGIQDLRSISTLVTEGKTCRTVENPNSAVASSSYAPDIFVDTVLDPDNGIGKYVDVVNVDTTSLALAKAFCKNNNLPLHDGGHDLQFFMDGIIADVGSWREFWVNNAPFSLLELARKNGVDTLLPALPCDSSGKAADDNGLPAEVPISALFTTGNILEDTYKEEFLNYGTATEDIIASIIYREYKATEVFSRNRSVEVKLADVKGNPNAVRETFDLSQFVTQRDQAIMFGKLLCNQRRHVRQGIEFQTFPTSAIVEPGAFIYVDVGLKQWDKYSSGVVMEGGVLNAPLMGQQDNNAQGAYFNFLLYNKTNGNTVQLLSVLVTTASGISTAASLGPKYVGYMFVMGQQKPSKRVYRVTEVAIEEEGEVSVKAIEYPCFQESGKTRAHIADFRSSLFDVS